MSDRTDAAIENDATRSVVPLVYNGTLIHERHEMLSLTDMWKAARSPSGRAPADWLALASTKEFASAVEASFNAGKSGIKTKTGRGGGTYAHWQIALAYAKYLNPDFHMWCNEVVRRHMEGAPPQLPAGLTSDDRAAIGGIIKSIVTKAVAELVPDLVRAEVVAAIDAKPAVPALDFGGTVSAYQMIEMAGVSAEDRQRGTAQTVTKRMIKFCADRGVACFRTPAEVNPSRPFRFPQSIASEWLLGEARGLELIRSQVDRMRAKKATCGRDSGQKILHLIQIPPSVSA